MKKSIEINSASFFSLLRNITVLFAYMQADETYQLTQQELKGKVLPELIRKIYSFTFFSHKKKNGRLMQWLKTLVPMREV